MKMHPIPLAPILITDDEQLAYLFTISVRNVRRLKHHPEFPEPIELTGGIKGWLHEDLAAFAESIKEVRHG